MEIELDFEEVKNEGEDLVVMGEMITLPPRKIWLHLVLPKILTPDHDVAPNRPVRIELVPAEDFMGKIQY
jgi:hypothetical protein